MFVLFLRGRRADFKVRTILLLRLCTANSFLGATLTMYCQVKRRVRESAREGLPHVHVVIVDDKTRYHTGNALPPSTERYVVVSCISNLHSPRCFSPSLKCLV